MDGVASVPEAASTVIALQPPRTQAQKEKKDAAWVRVLKPVLDGWVESKFVNATCAADMWLAMAEVNVFLRDWVMARFDVDAKYAVRFLTRRWRLPTRTSKKAAERVAAAVAADAPQPETKMTAAYRYLHRVVYHFYESIGNKAVSVFATHVNDNGGRGTLRRVRGTSTKLEVYFKPKDAAGLLEDNLFLKDTNCVAGLVRALAVIFGDYGVLHRFSEPRPTASGPRTLVCRNAYIALVATKVRAHLANRAQAKDSDDEAKGGDATDGDGGIISETGVPPPDADTGPVLNPGHRIEVEHELVTVGDIFKPWGTAAVNGLRISDARDSSRTDTTRPSTRPQRSPSAGVTAGAAAAAAAATAVAAASVLGSAAVADSGAVTGRQTTAVEGRPATSAAGSVESVPAGPVHLPPNGSNRDVTVDGRTNGAREGSMAISGTAAGTVGSNSTDGYTTTEGDGEEAPSRRRRTPAEMAAAAASRAARRVWMYEQNKRLQVGGNN